MVDKVVEKEEKKTQRKTEAEKPTLSDIAGDSVSGALEGGGQAFREFMLKRNIGEIFLGWLMTIATGHIAIKDIGQLLNDDPKLKELNHEQRIEIIEKVTMHAHLFLDRGRDGFLAVKEEIEEKLEHFYLELLRIANRRSADVLLYFNEVFHLEGDNRLTKQAQLVAFITQKVPSLTRVIQQWECQPLAESITAAQKRHVATTGNWWTFKYLGLAMLMLIPMILLGGTAYKAYGRSGGIVGFIAPVVFVAIIYYLRRIMHDRAQKSLYPDEGGVTHV